MTKDYMNNKKIFIDCGTHFGEGLDFFIKKLEINQDWEIHSFEANPTTFETFSDKSRYNHLQIKFYNLAVSDSDANVIFNRETPKNYPEEFMMGGGSSFMPIDEWNPWGTFKEGYNNSVEVRSLNLSNFINSLNSDNIYCKMDIEGAEFQTLEKMIEDGSIKKIKNIWIEFHENFFSNPAPYKKRKLKILEELSNNNVSYFEWH
jgi:FkbM family methyltransferase